MASLMAQTQTRLPADPSPHERVTGTYTFTWNDIKSNVDGSLNRGFESADADGDGVGDNADLDDDNDGIPDLLDAFPHDHDNDGSPDETDGFPDDAVESTDCDSDGIGDSADRTMTTTA